MAPTRSEKTHARSLPSLARHFFGSMVAGNCLFDMASKGCSLKNTSNRHYNLATGVLLMRYPNMIVTYHPRPHVHDTYPVVNGFDMSSTIACIRRRDPCHVLPVPQTDRIIVHMRQALRSKKRHHDISKMSKPRIKNFTRAITTAVRKPGHSKHTLKCFTTSHRKEIVKSEPRTVMIINII